MINRIKSESYKILKWSERYTKLDMLYLAKNGSWVSFGQFFNSLLSFILIIAFANLLPKETYGFYQYILSLAGVLNIFTLKGMNSAVSRAVATGNKGVLITSVNYQLKWNILMFIAFMMLGGYYLINENIVFATSFFILGVFVPPTIALNTYGSYLEGTKQFEILNIASVISTFIYVIGAFAVAKLSGDIVWLVAAYAITTFFPTLFFYVYILRKYKPPTDYSAITQDTIRYGRNLSFIKLIGPIASQIDKIILAHYWGPVILATYSIALVIPNRAVPFLKKFMVLGFPKFAAKTASEINTVFYRRIFQGMFIGGVVAIFYVLLSPPLFKYLLPQYVEGIVYSQILAITFIFAMPTRYLGLLFESQKMSRQILINSMINGVMAISLFIILGIVGGIIGLIVAKVLHSFFGMLVNLISWRKTTAASS